MLQKRISKKTVHVVGAGMAGSEAAYFLAERGHSVFLHEMRPVRQTEAHSTGNFAELVCSNSFKSRSEVSAPGILKYEMRALGSIVLEGGEKFQVPAGEALAVDREKFSEWVSGKIGAHPNITVSREEVSGLKPNSDEPWILATGPLTSSALTQWIRGATGETDLYFYDAIAPIIDATSIDRSKCFGMNRYGKGEEEAYLNCPLNEEEYCTFIDALMSAEKVAPKNFEKEILFQGCQPIESIAATGRDSLRFGPMKPVGLVDPLSGKRPYAVVQLRPENRGLSAYNLVGFQTKLKYGEQSRVFRLIPALKQAEFLRLGSIHRNTYVCSPRVLRVDGSLRGHPSVYLAGQITGVEGYLESAACGLLIGIFVDQRLRGVAHSSPPVNTGLGSLWRHVVASDPDHFQPGNMNFGLFDQTFFDLEDAGARDDVRRRIAEQCRSNFDKWVSGLGHGAGAGVAEK